MGIKILLLRHRTAPAQNGCRWCGFIKPDHANRHVPGKRWHTFAEPTDAQRLARRKARSGENYNALNRVPHIVTNIANDGRTRV